MIEAIKIKIIPIDKVDANRKIPNKNIFSEFFAKLNSVRIILIYSSELKLIN